MATGFNPYAMIAGLGGALGQGYKAGQGIVKDAQKQTVLASLGGAFGGAGGQFGEAAGKLAALGDVQSAVGLLTLEQKIRQTKQQEDAAKQFQGLFSGGGGQASAPVGAPMGGGAVPQIGTPNEVESRFINTVKQAGLTNPFGLAAVAATGKAESSYSPGNVNRTWNDPSESGQPGMAGGVMSWRGPRLQALQAFARQRGEAQPSVETQAMFLAQEDPQLLPRLNAAKSVEEANDIMANAWRFAGFDRPGGERDRRLAIARQYAPRFAPVDVAGSEADVQRLEAQGAPVQMAQAPQATASDAPAPGAVATQGFAVPGGQTQADPGEEGVYIKGVPTQRLITAKASPGITPQMASAIDAEIRAREARQKEVRGRSRPLIDPAERARYGIAPNDTRIYQVDGQGKLSSPSGSSVTVKNEGSIPAGYRAIRDEQGNVTQIEPIPGSPAAQEAAQAQEKQGLQRSQTQTYGNVVFDALNDVEKLMATATLPTTGPSGSLVAKLPIATNSRDIAASLDTIKANIGFERLNQMRQASPTGGALGAVTERELAFLQATLGSLEQAQSEQQFKSNLGRVRAIFERTVHGRPLTTPERRFGGPLTPETKASALAEAQAAVAAGADRKEVIKRLTSFGIKPEGL